MLDGLLFFPVTPFDGEDHVDLRALAAHIEAGMSRGAGAVFVACGTGELHALAVGEYADVVHTTVKVVAGRAPVFAGAGGAVALAREFVRAGRDAGAVGILLMPPYLVAGPPAGLVAYVADVAGASEIPLIVYHRGEARFDEDSALAVARLPNVVGFKDGVGDLDLMTRIVSVVREDAERRAVTFQFVNGLPTAEVSQAAYRAIGVNLYSSSSFAFAPDIALAFHEALETSDEALIHRLGSAFFHPLVRLRDTVPGYAVSLVKAGVELTGIASRRVRPPLVAATESDRRLLREIIADGRAVLAGSPAADTGGSAS